MANTFDAPQSRNEAILQNMLGAENELTEPESRIEDLLQQLLEAWENIDPGGGGGGSGEDGGYYTPSVSEAGVLSWTPSKSGMPSVADANVKGPAGADGTNGTDGTSAGFGTPTATVDSSVGTPGVTITASGPDTAKVFSFVFTNLKGEPGTNGTDGTDGTNGTNGTDGVSPTVQVTDITGGHRVTITDANGTQTFDVMNGTDGTNGTNGTDGAPGTDGTTFTPSVSNAGVISWTNDGNKQNPASVDLAAAVIAALPASPTVTTVSGATPSIALADDTVYSAGTLTSLTVTGSLNEGETCTIVFTSGSTATQLTMPASIKMPDSFAVEASKIYEISVMGTRGAVQSWATT